MITGFDIRTPIGGDELESRIAENTARALPELPVKTAHIIASGPSANAELWCALRSPGEPVVALNNALRLFTRRHTLPTHWCACDPQEMVADFLPDKPPTGVVYLLASKCHPKVFDKLKGNDVRIWHIQEPDQPKPPGLAIPTAASITLVTQSLFRFLGYHRFEMYGWDCCFLEDQAHATPQPIEIKEQTLYIDIADQRFHTTPAWLAELKDACVQTRNLAVMGYQVQVHGPGAVGALLRDQGLI